MCFCFTNSIHLYSMDFDAFLGCNQGIDKHFAVVIH